MLSLTPQERATVKVPFSAVAREKAQVVTIRKEDLRTAYLTNPLVHRGINIRANLIINRGYNLVFENDSVKECIERFLKNVKANDNLGMNFNMMIRQMAIDTEIFGNAFRLLVANSSGDKYVALMPLHPVSTDFKRNPMEEIQLDDSRKPVGFTFEDKSSGKKHDFERDEVVHLTFRTIGDEVDGIPLIMPIFNQMERLANIEEGLSQAIFKKGWPLHEAILKEKEDWTPKDTDVEYVDSLLDEIEAASHFTHTDDYELKIHDPQFPSSAVEYPTYFVNQIVSVTGVPKYILLGDESTHTKATAEALQQTLNPILSPLQERLAAIVETQIFQRVLQKEGINGYCKIQWNDVLPLKDERIAEKINILGATLVEGRPVIKWEEAREMLNLPKDVEIGRRELSKERIKTVAGIYVDPPGGKLIAQGRKTAIVKSIENHKFIGKPLALVSGNYIWGKVSLDSPVKIDQEQFEQLFWRHRLKDEDRKERFKDMKFMWYYPLQILDVFQVPKFYSFPKGKKTFMEEVKI